jgi:hypothetical protein
MGEERWKGRDGRGEPTEPKERTGVLYGISETGFIIKQRLKDEERGWEKRNNGH